MAFIFFGASFLKALFTGSKSNEEGFSQRSGLSDLGIKVLQGEEGEPVKCTKNSKVEIEKSSLEPDRVFILLGMAVLFCVSLCAYYIIVSLHNKQVHN